MTDNGHSPGTAPDANITADLATISRIDAVSLILRSLAEITGMRYAAVARVTETSWTACAVLDQLGFGVGPGDELAIDLTICKEVREQRRLIVFNQASAHPLYRDHPVPRHYGFESYVAVPIMRASGELFGTLCAIDPEPSTVENPQTIRTLELYAQLIGAQLDLQEKLQTSEQTRTDLDDRLGRSETALLDEKATGRLRDQFIAVLGHDLRSPLQSVMLGTYVLGRMALPPAAAPVLQNLSRGGARMKELIDNILDFARGQLGGGIPLAPQPEPQLGALIGQWVADIGASHRRSVELGIDIAGPVHCDANRLSQLLTNLLTNALVHGAPDAPVRVDAVIADGAFVLSVENGGAPIPPDKQSRLFLPFSRAPGEAASPGLGLGLYIAAEIARAHGGGIGVTSTAEQTRFEVRLPQP
jgi:signal transduction histidine kinase